MANTIKILFWVHRSKKNNKGMIPIKIRITYQNNKVDRSSGLWIPPEQWNAKKQGAKGNIDSAKNVNESIEAYLAKLVVIFRGYEQ